MPLFHKKEKLLQDFCSKETQVQVLSSQIYYIFRNSYFTEYHLTTAFDKINLVNTSYRKSLQLSNWVRYSKNPKRNWINYRCKFVNKKIKNPQAYSSLLLNIFILSPAKKIWSFQGNGSFNYWNMYLYSSMSC